MKSVVLIFLSRLSGLAVPELALSGNGVNIVEADGKILIAGDFTTVNGESRNTFARLNPDGTRDVGFNTLYFAGAGVYNITLQADGEILIGGAFVVFGSSSVTATGQPITRIENGTDVRALFVRRADHATAGLAYTPQFSGDLSTWEDSVTAATVLADDGTHQIAAVPYPAFVAGKPARFFRIKVINSP